MPFEYNFFMKSDICFEVIPLLITRSVLSLPDSNPKNIPLHPALRNACIFLPDKSALDCPHQGLLNLSK